MRDTHIHILFGIAMLCTMASAVTAVEIAIESDQLVVKDFDDSIGLGAFSVVIGYDPAKTSVTEVTFIEPFTGATNVQQVEKRIRVSGFTVQPQLTGDIPVARMVYEGEGRFDVYVDTLVNSKGDSVSTVNPTYDQGFPASPNTKPTTDATTEPTGGSRTVATVTASQTVSPQATEMITERDEDTPNPSPDQQIGDSGSPGGVELTLTGAEDPGTPVQTPAAQSPLPSILIVLAFAIALISLRRRA